MKRLINITAKAATAILAVALTASCVFEKDDAIRGNDRDMNNVLVQIGVSADGMTQTKADVIAGTDQAGEGVETAISTLRLYAYIDNVLSGYAYVPEYSATDKIYMDLKNLPSSGTQQVEFVAVANEGSMTGIDGIDIEVGTNPDGTISLPSNFGRNSFGGLKYTIANQEFTAIVDEKEKVVGMPMYATKTVTIDVDKVRDPNTGDPEGHFILQESVNLTLTRSLAKIEVYAAEAAAETTGKEATTTTSVTITGVSLANVPASGNLFTAPAATATLTYTDFNGEGVEGTGYSPSFLKAGTVDETAGTVNKKVSETATADIQNPDNYTLVSKAYYLAENNQGDEATYDFGATDYTTKATVLKIDYKVGGTDKTGYVKMPQIKRNTWYKVLARIQANGEIALVFVVKPWNVDKTVLTYSDVISITTPAAWSFEDSNNASFDDQKGEVSLRTSTDSYFKFKIDQPAGAKWTATLIPISGQLDSFKFIDDYGSEVSTVIGDVGTSKTLTIRPTGSPDAENNVASLRITIKTKEGNTKFVTPSELLKKDDVSYKEFTIIHSN